MTPIATFFNNALPFIVMAIIAAATYGLMCVAKHPIITVASFIVRARSSSGSTAVNSVAGIFGCECISVGLLYISEFLFSYNISTWWGVGAGLLATLVYLFIENIGDASFKKLGESLNELTDDDVTADAILAEVRVAVANAKAVDSAKVDEASKVTASAIIDSVGNIAKN